MLTVIFSSLSTVRSFGTEDRETEYPIAPQSQVYDYILFRGSDIKDIRVVNNVPPLPNDPAIMQMQLQNQIGGPHGHMHHQNFQPQFPVPVMGHMGQPVVGPFQQQYGGIMGNLAGMTGGLQQQQGGVGGVGGVGGLTGGFNKKQPSEFNVDKDKVDDVGMMKAVSRPDIDGDGVEHKDQGVMVILSLQFCCKIIQFNFKSIAAVFVLFCFCLLHF